MFPFPGESTTRVRSSQRVRAFQVHAVLIPRHGLKCGTAQGSDDDIFMHSPTSPFVQRCPPPQPVRRAFDLLHDLSLHFSF